MQVSLHKVTRANWQAVLQLQLPPEQQRESELAANVQSLAEAYVDPTFHPFAVYPGDCREPEPGHPVVGFALFELCDCGVGFIGRLMIDHRHQGNGYGRATVVELIRRLRLHPHVQRIATSYRAQNERAAKLYRSLGFVEWDVSHWRQKPEGEVFLTLDK